MNEQVELVDTHCHIQFPDYGLDAETVLSNAHEAGVNRMIAVGCTLADSKAATEYAKQYDEVWASIGLHPHETAGYVDDHHALQQFRDLVAKNKVVAIGETGLDYYYEHSPKDAQKKMFRFQLDLAEEFNLPLIFHVREAFEDFWSIVDEYHGLRGVVHSFSSILQDVENIVKRGFFVGLNGIMTFTKRDEQLIAAKAVPLNKLVLETDAPFLTPVPNRGKMCEPKHVRDTAQFLAELRGESLQDLARATTNNAKQLFNLS